MQQYASNIKSARSIINKLAEEVGVLLTASDFSTEYKRNVVFNEKTYREVNRPIIAILEHILTAINDVKNELYPKEKTR